MVSFERYVPIGGGRKMDPLSRFRKAREGETGREKRTTMDDVKRYRARENTEAEELERELNFCDIERVGEDDDGEGVEEGGKTVVALIGHATVTVFFTLVSLQ